ncbi:MAG TPA: ferredoxin [Acidimicrobiales bacterium]|nr:ferredoxin [Acidimicrobiales bacterium]
MPLEVRVTQARCIATKACVNAAEGVFTIVGGVAVVVDPEAAPEDDVLRAAEACPTAAIAVFRDGEQIA